MSGKLIVHGDATQTATNILAAERLFRLGIVGNLITFIATVALVWALYIVLAPINRNLALLAVLWRLAECSVIATSTLGSFVALRLLSGVDSWRGIDSRALQALALMVLGAQGDGYRIAFVFLGLGSALFSYLWFESNYIPRALAVWGIFSSLTLALVTLAVMVFPAVAARLSLTYMVPMFIYEVGLGFWLLVKGAAQRSIVSMIAAP